MTENSEKSHGLQARIAAQAILEHTLRKRRTLDESSDAVLAAAGLEPRDAGFGRAIASETLRRFGQIEALIRQFVTKPVPSHRAGPTTEILMAGICELLFLNVAPHAAIDAANRLCARNKQAVHFKPLVNAVLRRVAGEGRSLVEIQDAARLNTPDWLWQRWCDIYGEEITRVIAAAHGAFPPLDLSLKTSASTRPVEGTVLFDNVVRLARPGRVDALQGFQEGAWWVQDAAASLPVRLLGDIHGATVLDLCAAPGGKTAQLLAGGAQVTALDNSGERLSRLRENLARLEFEAELIEADIREWKPSAPAQFVLLDAPCSATGTIRRHPDLPWIKNAADMIYCAQGAGELLDAASEMVAPGGLLVFTVCSLEPEEGSEQISAFLDRTSGFERVPVSPSELFGKAEWITADGDLRTLPCHLADQGGMDGFYAARLRRL